MPHRFSLGDILKAVVAGILVLMAGCGAPADSLDAVINATSAREYNRWWNNHRAALPHDIEERYLAAIQVLELEMSIWPQRPSMNDRDANLFQMLDDATVRKFIVS